MLSWFRPDARGVRTLTVLAALAGTFALTPCLSRADVILTAGADKKVKIWNTEGTLIKTIDAHDGAVNVLVSSPDGKLVATGGADKKVKIWNTADGTLVKSIDAHEGAVTALAFSADGAKLFSGGADKKMKIWNPATGKSIATFNAHDGSVIFIGPFSPEATITAGADGKIKFWMGEGDPFTIPGEHGALRCISHNPKKQMLYTGGENGKIDYLSQGASGTFDGMASGAIQTLAPFPDGAKLLSGDAEGKVKIWDADTYKLVTTVDDAHKGGVTAITVTPDGKMILTGGADKKVKVWDATGKLVKTVDNVHDGAVTVILYIKDKPKEEKKENAK